MIEAALNAIQRCLTGTQTASLILNSSRLREPTLILSAEIVATQFKFSETRYTQMEDINIAHHVAGDGPVDIVVAPRLCSQHISCWALNRHR
jgi:hypothetical protein